uniref:Uncharacterized protein n=1 Tax=Panagrolaimus davidi TaxID=227884 RepID=A0A914QEX2_9BILA
MEEFDLDSPDDFPPHSSSPPSTPNMPPISAISSTVQPVIVEQSTIPATTSASTTTTDVPSTQNASLILTSPTTAASPSETTSTSLSTTFAAATSITTPKPLTTSAPTTNDEIVIWRFIPPKPRRPIYLPYRGRRYCQPPEVKLIAAKRTSLATPAIMFDGGSALFKFPSYIGQEGLSPPGPFPYCQFNTLFFAKYLMFLEFNGHGNLLCKDKIPVSADGKIFIAEELYETILTGLFSGKEIYRFFKGEEKIKGWYVEDAMIKMNQLSDVTFFATNELRHYEPERKKAALTIFCYLKAAIESDAVKHVPSLYFAVGIVEMAFLIHFQRETGSLSAVDGHGHPGATPTSRDYGTYVVMSEFENLKEFCEIIVNEITYEIDKCAPNKEGFNLVGLFYDDARFWQVIGTNGQSLETHKEFLKTNYLKKRNLFPQGYEDYEKSQIYKCDGNGKRLILKDSNNE